VSQILKSVRNPSFTWAFGIVPFLSFLYVLIGWHQIESLSSAFAPILLFGIIAASIICLLCGLEKSRRITVGIGVCGWVGTVVLYAYHLLGA
jgi:hypothetical protein